MYKGRLDWNINLSIIPVYSICLLFPLFRRDMYRRSVRSGGSGGTDEKHLEVEKFHIESVNSLLIPLSASWVVSFSIVLLTITVVLSRSAAQIESGSARRLAVLGQHRLSNKNQIREWEMKYQIKQVSWQIPKHCFTQKGICPRK